MMFCVATIHLTVKKKIIKQHNIKIPKLKKTLRHAVHWIPVSEIHYILDFSVFPSVAYA